MGLWATLAPILLVMQLIRLALTLKRVKTQSASRDELTNNKGQPVSTINAIHDLEKVTLYLGTHLPVAT